MPVLAFGCKGGGEGITIAQWKAQYRFGLGVLHKGGRVFIPRAPNGIGGEGVVVACTMLGSAPLVHIVAIGYGIRYGVLLVDWTQHTKIPSQFLATDTLVFVCYLLFDIGVFFCV